MDFYTFVIYFTLAAFAFLITLAGRIYYIIRIENPDREKIRREDEQWLEEEKLKPKYCVSFETKDGVQTKHVTGFEPRNTKTGEPHNIRLTSKRRAEKYLSYCFERGFFIDGDGKYYPIYNINSAQLEIESK
jgi:hypothetical protein